MRPGSVTKSLLVVLWLAASVLPQPALAKAGGGQSLGSRGSHTYQQSPSSAQPVQRSATPQPPVTPPPGQPGPYQRPPAPYQPAPAPVGHPFMTGLAGGLIGAGVAHMLFGSGGFGGGFGMGMGGGGGSPGLLHFLLIGGLIYLAYRVIKSMMNRGTGAGMPMAPLGYTNNNDYNNGASFAGPPLQPASQPLMLNEDDRSAFGQAFLAIQSAWSDRDFTRLQHLMTPEMISYFNEQLSANMSQGLINRVEQVQIQGIDLVEAWQEASLAYASVVIKWTAKDYMVRADRHPGDADYDATPGSGLAALDQEQWTFVRAQGGHWLLSAIQQM